jgi:hypothetical protein
MKYTVFIIICMLIIGCDPLIKLNLNANNLYHLDTSCGIVEFKSSLLTSHIFINQRFIGEKLLINKDSLKIMVSSPRLNEVLYTSFVTNEGVEIKENSFWINCDKEFILEMKLKYALNHTEFVSILPCNYIMCNNKPLITDTIRIKFGK